MVHWFVFRCDPPAIDVSHHDYIGSAKSHGSPYGSAAVVAVFLVPFVFIRLYSPPQYLAGVLLACVSNISTMILLDGSKAPR